MAVLSAWMYGPRRPEEDGGVRDGYEPPHVFWEPDLGPLEEQQPVLLTADPPLQPRLRLECRGNRRTVACLSSFFISFIGTTEILD